MKSFANKVVVVTGAGSGIGRAIAVAFAKRDARLGLSDLNEKGLQETAQMIASLGKPAPFTRAFDITDENAVVGFASEVESSVGSVAILINNAGIEGSARPVWATDQEHFRKVMEVNYFAVVNCTKTFLPQIAAGDEGAIVNVSSIFGLIGTPNHADYCASKFAVRGFTESLMTELYESPIQVQLLHPGGIATNIAQLSHSQSFANHYLKTAPERLAEHLIQSIAKNKPRIVFGRGAKKSWLSTVLVPLGLRTKLIWSELKRVIDLSDYPFK